MAVCTNARSEPPDRNASLVRLLLAGTFLFAWMSACAGAAEINVGYLRRTDPKSTLSLIQTPAKDDGVAGARLAIDDNNTTGRFLNQQFSLEDVPLSGDANAGAATIALAERGVSLMVADLRARCCSSMSVRPTIDCGRKTAAPM